MSSSSVCCLLDTHQDDLGPFIPENNRRLITRQHLLLLLLLGDHMMVQLCREIGISWLALDFAGCHLKCDYYCLFMKKNRVDSCEMEEGKIILQPKGVMRLSLLWHALHYGPSLASRCDDHVSPVKLKRRGVKTKNFFP